MGQRMPMDGGPAPIRGYYATRMLAPSPGETR